MEKPFTFLRFLSYLLFIIFISIGLLYILASPVVPALTISRIIIGISLIILGLIILVVISILIQKRRQISFKSSDPPNQVFPEQDEIPHVIICKECKKPIQLPDNYHGKKRFICESCGTENVIPKSTVKW